MSQKDNMIQQHYEDHSGDNEGEEVIPLTLAPGIEVVWVAIEKEYFDDFANDVPRECWELISERKLSRATYDGDLGHKRLLATVAEYMKAKKDLKIDLDRALENLRKYENEQHKD